MSITKVENASRATRFLAQTTLRNVLGTRSLSEILSEREAISHSIQVSKCFFRFQSYSFLSTFPPFYHTFIPLLFPLLFRSTLLFPFLCPSFHPPIPFTLSFLPPSYSLYFFLYPTLSLSSYLSPSYLTPPLYSFPLPFSPFLTSSYLPLSIPSPLFSLSTSSLTSYLHPTLRLSLSLPLFHLSPSHPLPLLLSPTSPTFLP